VYKRQGEERHARLYSLIEEGMQYLVKSPSTDALLALRLRLLHELGYVSLSEKCKTVCFAETLESALTTLANTGVRHDAEKSISLALSASHL
jgi:recombinational DNA repair protein (RecF pathway)